MSLRNQRSERYEPYPRPNPSSPSSSVDGYCPPHQVVPPRRTPRMRVSYTVTRFEFQLTQRIIDESLNEAEEEEEEEEEEDTEEFTTTGDADADVATCFEARTHWGPREDEDEEAEVCSICLLEYQDEETVAALQCGHEFHEDCIKKWLWKKKTCPFCRASVQPLT